MSREIVQGVEMRGLNGETLVFEAAPEHHIPESLRVSTISAPNAVVEAGQFLVPISVEDDRLETTRFETRARSEVGVTEASYAVRPAYPEHRARADAERARADAERSIWEEIDAIHKEDKDFKRFQGFMKLAIPISAITAIVGVIGTHIAALEALPGVTAVGEITGVATYIWNSLPWLLANPTLSVPTIAAGFLTFSFVTFLVTRALEKNVEKVVNYGF